MEAPPGVAPPRLDQDDAVRAAAAVDGRRRSVLQNRDRADVRGIEQVQRTARRSAARRRRPRPSGFGFHVRDRHAVDDVQRLVAGAEGRRAANQDLHAGPGLAVVRRDIDAAVRPCSIWFTFVTTPTLDVTGSTVDTEPVTASRG